MSALTDLLVARRNVLLDFDGPICSVFSSFSSKDAARELAESVCEPLPSEVAASSDPFDILRFTAAGGSPAIEVIERKFTELELKAIAVARPTPYAADAMHMLVDRRYRIVVVSNNSVTAVESYLRAHDLQAVVSGVYGRTSDNVEWLKPNPHLLNVAMKDLGSEPNECVFVGDSVTDIEASARASVPAVGFANRPGKAERFAESGAAVVITSMEQISGALPPIE
ncbi:HAD family hydrolase [Nocardia sp. NPDC057030]|uniref:HAD family hydrolase n=1 Tax=unclassified Nocardia TaxID=2637762 RepID=UPI003641FAE4